MRAEHLFSILGLVDPALIDEAMDPSAARRRQRAVWRRYAAVAACCVLVCGALLWSVRFLGMGGSDTATTEDTAGTAEEQESAATGSDGSDGGSLPQAPGGGFFSYAGPVLPLTTLEPDTGLTAERTLTLDFAPGTHADGASSQWGAGVTDRYVLTNPTADDVTVTALYPVTGSLAGLSETVPQLAVSGAAASYTLYAGGYAGAFGDENDRNGSTHNLAGPYSWEDYAALVSCLLYTSPSPRDCS